MTSYQRALASVVAAQFGSKAIDHTGGHALVLAEDAGTMRELFESNPAILYFHSFCSIISLPMEFMFFFLLKTTHCSYSGSPEGCWT